MRSDLASPRGLDDAKGLRGVRRDADESSSGTVLQGLHMGRLFTMKNAKLSDELKAAHVVVAAAHNRFLRARHALRNWAADRAILCCLDAKWQLFDDEVDAAVGEYQDALDAWNMAQADQAEIIKTVKSKR
jgi:hypothetical protein